MSRPEQQGEPARLVHAQDRGEPVEDEAAEKSTELHPHIYVASLSDYNAGILHGAWLDATDTVEGLQEGIDVMLSTSPTARRTGEPAEEWRIHDFDEWGHIDIHGFESLETIARLAAGLQQHGDAFGAWVEVLGDNDAEEVDAFEEYYLGEYDSLEDYGRELLEDMGVEADGLPGIPEGLRPYVRIDVAGWVRDMELSGEIADVECAGGVYVFWTI